MDVLGSPGVRGEGGRSSRVVLISRRWDQVLRDVFARRRGPTSPEPRGERGAAVNTIAQGTPVVSAALLMLACAKCTFLCTQGSRVRPASGVPCALHLQEGHDRCIARASSAARMR